ncbi:hypothetical protein CVT26_010801 [Gymnopilus dilepis]|uniref:Uncharacterized protein n=1 Tax=Gymnopilus dilepis TaxID=231916 RepID=A0A409VIH8_9AGAR|nr:hypothetical protein CVT26_010801 [Gymnopilus dilepis]
MTTITPTSDVRDDHERVGQEKKKNSPIKQTTINYAKYVSHGIGLDSIAGLTKDGRISLNFDFKKRIPTIGSLTEFRSRDVEEFGIDQDHWKDCPKLSIVIMIVGSRGDVQPYVALGKELLKDGHRVRMATHETFRAFVNEAGLEFFNIGGNPQDLMSYMVKNPGLIPGIESLANGDIGKKRRMLNEMINGCWDACHSPDPVSGRSFAADAIISNPPAFAHIHCAEALGIPLHLSFTMPWSPTTAFPHPLVNITDSNAGYGVNNYLSYAAADLLTWHGIVDIINDFRTRVGLPSLSIRSGPGYVDRLKVPWSYCMSPALVPKPDDWKNHIDVTGFYFLDLASNYQPSPALAAFLSAGEAPVYIGFGSVVVDDPNALTEIVFEATRQAGVRALVSSGWGNLGGNSVPSNVFLLGNVPHDWLFAEERVSAVVHHGGAGTTAIGLAEGRPTVVVPFFGDQGFWGNMIYKAGAGPKPIPQKELTAKRLAEAIKFALSPPVKEAAKSLAEKICYEDGVRRGIDSFYKHLPLLNMRCALDPSRVAVWWSKEHSLRLSVFAAQTLADANLISMQNLVLHRPKEYRSHKGTSEQSKGGGANAYFWSLTGQSKSGGKSDETTASSHGILDAVTSVHEGLRRGYQSRPSQEYVDARPGHNWMSSITSASSVSSDGSAAKTIQESKSSKNKSVLGAIKHFVSRSRRPQEEADHPRPTSKVAITAPASITVHGAWKLTETLSGKTVYTRERLTRIAEGRKAVNSSTESERRAVIERFQRQTSATPTTTQQLSPLELEGAARVDDTSDVGPENRHGNAEIRSPIPLNEGQP